MRGAALLLLLWVACREAPAGPRGGPPDAGPLRNRFEGDAAAIAEGRKLYQKYGCAGCHGAGGGGGMGKPILDDEWRFGGDDPTLFKLIRGQIPKQTMPVVVAKDMTDDEVWKTLAFVRSLYQGDASKIVWGQPKGGRALFVANCAPCHGEGGKGDGPAAATLEPKPRDLTDAAAMGKLEDGYVFELLQKGGAALGKSAQMPKAALDAGQIREVIGFVRTLSGGPG